MKGDFLSGEEFVEATGAQLLRPPRTETSWKQVQLRRLAPLPKSSRGDLCFLFAPKYWAELPQAAPEVLLLGPRWVEKVLGGDFPNLAESWILTSEDPYLSLARASAFFSTEQKDFPGPLSKSAPAEVHPTAVLGAGVQLEPGVQVGPYCVLEAGVRVGRGTVIQAFCYLGAGCEIGADCFLFPRVTLYPHTELGNGVRLHAGVVLGADGFGYAPVLEDGKVIRHEKIHHLGKVQIGDRVEIGANSTIDRGTLAPTTVASEAKIDNLVHLAHNVQVETGAVLCGATAVAGNSTIGAFSYLAGAVWVANDLRIGPGALVGGMTLVSKDVPAGGKVVGNPQRDYADHFRIQALLNRMLKRKEAKASSPGEAL